MTERAQALPQSAPGRYRRALHILGSTVGLTAVFVAALTVSVALHLDLAPVRRTVRAVANQILGNTFQGKLVVGEIDRLSLRGLSIRWAEAYDPHGERVLHADGLHARLDAPAVLRSLFGGGDLRVPIPLVRLEHADVALEKSERGVTLADVFMPRTPSTAPPSQGGRNVRLTLERVEIDHVWAHGGLAAPALIDAELAGASGRLEVSPDGLAIDVTPAHLTARAPVPQPLLGNAGFHLHGSGGRTRMDTTFEGRLGDLDVTAQAALEGVHVSAKVEIPHATPEVIASLVPGPKPDLPLRVPVAATVEAEGDLPDIDVKARVRFEGGGAVATSGRLTVNAPVTLDTSVEIDGVDPRVAIDLPSASPVHAKAHVKLELGDRVKLTASAHTQAFAIADNPIPAVDADASYDGVSWHGQADVHEEGVPAHASFGFDPKAGITFDVDARTANLKGIRRVPIPADGAASVKVTGSLRDGKLDARVSGRFDHVRAGKDVALADGGIEGRVRGPLAQLDVDATVTGRSMRAGGYAWEKVTAHVRGPALAPKIDADLDEGGGEKITAEGAVDARAKAITGVKVTLKRKAGEVGGEVERIAATPQGLAIEGLRLQGHGVGRLQGGLVVQGKEIVGHLRGENVDLAKVALLAGLKQDVSGLANVDVDLTSSRQGSRKGHINLEIANGAAAGLMGISGVVSATFDGDHVRTDALVRVVDHATPEETTQRCDGAIAQIRITGGDGTLPGPLLDPGTWQRMFGKVEVAAEDFRLRCLARRLGPLLPLSEVHGKMTARATFERAPNAPLPTVSNVLVRTRGLAVAGELDKSGKPEWDSRFMDVELKGRFDPSSGVTAAKLTLLDEDPIASLTARATLDVPVLLNHPERAEASLRSSPVTLHLAIPRRAVTGFASLPSFVRTYLPLLAGDVQVDADVDGTPDKPTIAVRAKAWQIAHATVVEAVPATPPKELTEKEKPQPQKTQAQKQKAPAPVAVPAPSPWGLPLDLDVAAGYDGSRATLDAKVQYAGSEIGAARADLAVALADLLAGRPFKPKGFVTALFRGVPIGDIPFFADRGVEGKLAGTFALTGLGDHPELKVDLELPELKVGHDLTYERAAVLVDVGKAGADGRSSAKANVVLQSKAGGKLTVSGSSAVRWKGGLFPDLDETGPAEVTTKAEKFRIAVAAPFVANVLSRLDGVLDGDSRVAFGKPGQAPIVSAQMKLTQGVFHVPQLGQELHQAQVTIQGGAGGVIELKDIQAEGTRGLLTGWGKATLNGLLFQRAEAHFQIQKGDDLPVTLEGVPLGDAHGELAIVAEQKGQDLTVDVNVPTLHVDLPPALTRSVVPLDDNPDVFIKNSLAPAGEQHAPDGRKIAITINLGALSILGKVAIVNLDVGLHGLKSAPIKVEIGGEKALVSGDIVFSHGRIEVLQRQFEIEQGSIHLRPEDPGNPFINVKARWDSPDGPIYIEYVGKLPVVADNIKFDSPTIPKDRITATLLAGSTEQPSSAGTASGSTPGTSLAAQLIASQFSTRLSSNISTSIGAGDDGSIRPGFTYQVGDLMLEFSTYGMGGGMSSGSATVTAAGATAPKGPHSLVTIEKRFPHHWTLRGHADVGSDSQSAGGEMFWQYRY